MKKKNLKKKEKWKNKETDDINFIHKMTKYPRSEIINVAKLASINIKI